MKYSLKLKYKLKSLSSTRGIDTNDLQASDGRDIEALNCKPITNL